MVSIVVIGYNEANNLHDTFKAINSINYPKELIYVDTNSIDNSVEIAKKYTNKVFIEKREWSTPGLARNRGLIEAKFDIVHFIDGDITIDKDYIKKAVDKIQEPNIDAVYGFLEEKSSEGVNNILLTHWAGRKEGYHKATGGGGTYLKSALLSVNGYDERIRRGQETELGERFLNGGFKIWFMEERMGEHDYGVKTVVDLIKIFFFDGFNKSQIYLTNGRTEFYKLNKRNSISNLLFFFILTIVFSILLYFTGFFAFFYVLILYYSYFVFKYLIMRKHRDIKKIKYFFMMYSFKIVTLIGQIIFFIKATNKNYRNSVVVEKDKLT